jgi:hypothetical protein
MVPRGVDVKLGNSQKFGIRNSEFGISLAASLWSGRVLPTSKRAATFARSERMTG